MKPETLIYCIWLFMYKKASALSFGPLFQQGTFTFLFPFIIMLHSGHHFCNYHYPTPGETTHTNFAKVIPQQLSDYLLFEDKKNK